MQYNFKKDKADLSDLKFELWLRKRLSNRIVYECRNRLEVSISDLPNDTLLHEIKYLEKYGNK